MSEEQIVQKFKDMCAESLSPDLYSMLFNKILPPLRLVRKSLKQGTDTKPCGMYHQSPVIQIGPYAIRDMSIPDDGFVWIEDENAGDGMSLSKSILTPVLKDVYDRHF